MIIACPPLPAPSRRLLGALLGPLSSSAVVLGQGRRVVLSCSDVARLLDCDPRTAARARRGLVAAGLLREVDEAIPGTLGRGRTYELRARAWVVA